MVIHIMSIGVDIKHAYTALNSMGFDRVYLIVGSPEEGENESYLKKYHQSQENANELKKYVEQGNVSRHAEIIEVPAFNKDTITSLLKEYQRIIQKEKGNEIHINITGGTNLMGAVALSAAYFYNVNAYYVLNPTYSGKETILNLPIPKIVYTDSLTSKQKEILCKIGNRTHLKTISELVDKKTINSIQAVKPHIESLEKMGLITIKKTGKRCEIELSESGKIIYHMIK